MNAALQNLIQLFDKHVALVGQAMERFPLENKERYAAWLAQTYFFVRHTTRFLTIAAANAPIEERDLHYDMIHHLKGELHHDQVALNDLAAMGYKPTDFPEMIETSLLYQSQYYWLERTSVPSLIGYALLLEGLACKHGPMMLARIERHGKKATAFLRLHCEVDVAHYADGLKSLEQYKESDYPLIARNLEQTSQTYIQMLERVARGEAQPTLIQSRPAQSNSADSRLVSALAEAVC